MMSQSVSLTNALKAVERVLNSDTSDLKALAKVAGVAPEELYFQADLTGLDLRGMDIDFLLPLQTRYEGAVLTDKQRSSFRKAGKQQRELRIKDKIRDLREQAVIDFIQRFEEDDLKYESVFDGEALTTEMLRKLLLYPLVEQSNRNASLTPNYSNFVLSSLAPWVSSTNYFFIESVFTLLASMLVPTNSKIQSILHRDYHLALEGRVVGLIGQLHATTAVDEYWLSHDGPDGVLNAAIELGQRRSVDATAIERNLSGLSEKFLLTLFEEVPFECDADQAERFSMYLISKDWAATDTMRMLNAKVNPRIRSAIYRQILGQGNQLRVAEVIRWLEDSKGAAGALSLENAFVHIKDFELSMRLAIDLAPRLKPNQLVVVQRSLKSLALTSADQSRVQKFCSKY